MVTDGTQTYCGGHFAIIQILKSCCIPQTNIMLLVNYTSLKNEDNIKKKPCLV